jgi:hypothetical protein
VITHGVKEIKVPFALAMGLFSNYSEYRLFLTKGGNNLEETSKSNA